MSRETTNGAMLAETSAETEWREPQTRAASLRLARPFTAEALERALHRLADSGWNTVIIPGFFGGYPIFPSQVWADHGLRRQHPVFRKWDPFEVAFDVAWRRHLDIFVSVTPYLAGSAGPGRKPPLLRHRPKWGAAGHPIRKRRPKEAKPALRYYCPVNLSFRRFLCDTLFVLLEDYPFHGLQIDLRHYPFYSSDDGAAVLWCYCEACRRGTLRDLGFDPAEVDFAKERSMVERWQEWQASQMDDAMAYIRMRALKARRTMRILGLLTTDADLDDKRPQPLIHWRTWVERSLVEGLVLDGYSPELERFSAQLRADVEMLPSNSLLNPMLPRKARDTRGCLALFRQHPIPGFTTRFEEWDKPDFDPDDRIVFDSAAFAVESDPLQSITLLFERMARAVPEHDELGAFLGDLGRVLTHDDRPLTVSRALMVAENLRGLRKQVAEGDLPIGSPRRERLSHDLDLACRLAHLAGCDLMH